MRIKRQIDQKTKSAINAVGKIYWKIPPDKLSVVYSGHLTKNYVIETIKNKLFLKCYRSDGKRTVDEIHKVIKFFDSNGIPVIVPLSNPDGSSFTKYNGLNWAVFPFVKGKSKKSNEITDKGFISMAKMLADIHLLTKNKNRNIIPKGHGIWNKKVFLRDAESFLKILKSKKNRNNFDKLSYQVLKLKINLAKKNQITPDDLDLGPDHLIHGDYHNGNIFFNNDDDVIYVFDLDMTQYRPRVYEVIRSMHISCLESFYDQEHVRRAMVYLRAYNRKYPLTRDEFRAGMTNYFLSTVHSLWIESFHYRDGNKRADIFLKSQLRDLQFYLENLETLTQTLSKALNR